MASEVKLPKREEKATTSAWLAGLAMRKKARSWLGLGLGLGLRLELGLGLGLAMRKQARSS